MYKASVIPVMIASPSDVQNERDAVKEIINEWNFTESFGKQIVLLPVGWDTHSSPEMGLPPQEQINNRILERCDILVGIFWTRIGSPTKSEPSGTVEEIKRHTKAGKPAMIYFSEMPVAPSSMDAKQWDERESFRKWCGPEGLYETFNSIEELKRKFERQLRLCINENDHIKTLVADFERIDEQVGDGLEQVEFPVEAVEILREAAKSNDGTIYVRNYIGGWDIQTNSTTLAENCDAQTEAKWRAAIEKLDNYGLIEERSFGSGLYFVTHEGYETIERLNTSSS